MDEGPAHVNRAIQQQSVHYRMISKIHGKKCERWKTHLASNKLHPPHRAPGLHQGRFLMVSRACVQFSRDLAGGGRTGESVPCLGHRLSERLQRLARSVDMGNHGEVNDFTQRGIVITQLADGSILRPFNEQHKR